MKQKNYKLLTQNDPAPVTVIKRAGSMIISSPHNGIAVPSCLPPYLGTDKEWFNNAHEAMDLHIDKLLLELANRLDSISFIAGNYSRLVCDLNALPDYAITKQSTEYRNIEIPENQRESCCIQQCAKRLEEIYWPYHNEKEQLINQKREEFGGVIVLDIHSFSPTWQQTQRNVEIGTIRCEKTPFSRAFEEYLRSQSNFTFVSGQPYRVEDIPTNAAPLISKKNDLQYLGIEIRNDLIANNDGIKKIANLIESGINHVISHENITEITKARSEITSPPLTHTCLNDATDRPSWEI